MRIFLSVKTHALFLSVNSVQYVAQTVAALDQRQATHVAEPESQTDLHSQSASLPASQICPFG